jgi:hypothetical protein
MQNGAVSKDKKQYFGLFSEFFFDEHFKKANI